MEKMTRREFSAHMKRGAPENSDEWHFFNEAETRYEEAETLKNKGRQAKSARCKAVRAFKKGFALFQARTK
jgi:hypothetical protein